MYGDNCSDHLDSDRYGALNDIKSYNTSSHKCTAFLQKRAHYGLTSHPLLVLLAEVNIFEWSGHLTQALKIGELSPYHKFVDWTGFHMQQGK